MGFMNGDLDSDDDDDDEPTHKHNDKHSALAAAIQPQTHSAIPLASPRPGYAAPIAALNLSRPSPAPAPEVRQQPQLQAPQAQRPIQMQVPQAQRHPQMPQAQRPMQMPQAPRQMQIPRGHPQMSQVPPGLRPGPGAPLGPLRVPPSPRSYPSSPISSVPSTPHPLEEPVTPITPAFLRPTKTPDSVQFATEPIMRSDSEDHLLPRRGDKGDDFWRRFSMVAKEESNGERESSWLKKTQNGTTRMSRLVCVIGAILIICIAGGIGVGWYFTHNNPSHQQPEVFGGSADEGITSTTSSSALSSSSTAVHGILSSPHVSPTNTVARRAAVPDPAPTPIPFQKLHSPHAQSGLGPSGGIHLVPSKRHRQVNRTRH